MEMDRYETPLTPESWGKLGMWVFLAGDAMSFGGLLAGYGALRIAAGPNWPSPQQHFGISLTAFMTFLLICSSVTMVKSLSAIRHGDAGKMKLYLGLTVLGGILFLGMQAYEWTHLIHDGLKLSGHPYGGSSLFGTTFFIITGFHGCHVLGGVIYLGTLLVSSMIRPYTVKDGDKLEIAGLYWHFVDLIWILVFTFIYLI
jgi:heme/copper-type cytochrome/quinol oxidase subunit 3